MCVCHLFDWDLLDICSGPGNMMEVGDTAEKKSMIPALAELLIPS